MTSLAPSKRPQAPQGASPTPQAGSLTTSQIPISPLATLHSPKQLLLPAQALPTSTKVASPTPKVLLLSKVALPTVTSSIPRGLPQLLPVLPLPQVAPPLLRFPHSTRWLPHLCPSLPIFCVPSLVPQSPPMICLPATGAMSP